MWFNCHMATADVPLAIVTGAARRLGRAFALRLARRGYALLLHYFSSEQEAARTAEEIRALGVPAALVQADLRQADAAQVVFAAADAQPHRLRVLVNSAAMMPRGDARTLSAAEWDAVMALNLRAPFLLAQQAARRMSAGGLIVNVTDVGAARAWSGFPAYTVSKAGLDSLTRVLARAFAPQVRVNAIAPGLVLPSGEVDEEQWRRLVERTPLRRPADPDEVAAALDFLLDNPYVTGQTLTVDGGFSLV